MSVDADNSPPKPLKHTPLHALHLSLGAQMGPFAGYDMPLQYAGGVLQEHRHTREAAGLFDVSHMGQILLTPKSGNLADAARALESLVPADILGLAPGRQRYTFFTNGHGGILDDLMVGNGGDHFHLVVNAACKEGDEALLRDALSASCNVMRIDRALLALQGPKAEAALARMAPGCRTTSFMEVREMHVADVPCVVARSGYTGEDGFEISIPPDSASKIAEALLEDPDVAPIGLAARDTLRLEAGLCLYGADIDDATTPVMAGLAWAIPDVRRAAGDREGGFPGAPTILSELEHGAERPRVGLLPQGRAPVRAGAPIFAQEAGETSCGRVTSGSFGPSVNRPVAMGYVPAGLSKPGTLLFADVRGKRLSLIVAHLPFVDHRYKRAQNRNS